MRYRYYQQSKNTWHVEHQWSLWGSWYDENIVFPTEEKAIEYIENEKAKNTQFDKEYVERQKLKEKTMRYL